MKKGYALRGGKVLGKDHFRTGKNSQDGFALQQVVVEGKRFWLGVIADGCSQGASNEVAGLLLPQFAVNEIYRLLFFGISVCAVPDVLYPALVRFLETLKDQFFFTNPQEESSFVQNFLLATVIGFVVGEDEGVVFSAGDGLIQVNEEVLYIDYDNRSPYLAYHLLSQGVLEKSARLPRGFEVMLLDVDDLKKLAVASDGFNKTILDRLWVESKKAPLGLQLWMNWVNGPRNPVPEAGLFYDDASIVTLEAKKEEEHAESSG